MEPYSRGEDDLKCCIVLGIQLEKASNLRGAVRTLVEAPLVHHVGTLQTPPPPPSERVLMLAPRDPPPYETAELGVTSKAPPALRRVHATGRLSGSFEAVDDFDSMLSAGIRSSSS